MSTFLCLFLLPVLRGKQILHLFQGVGDLVKSQDPEASRAEAGPFYSCWKKLKAETGHASKDIHEVSS